MVDDKVQRIELSVGDISIVVQSSTATFEQVEETANRLFFKARMFPRLTDKVALTQGAGSIGFPAASEINCQQQELESSVDRTEEPLPLPDPFLQQNS